MLKSAKDAALYGTSVDIHKVVQEDEMIAAMHEHAEKFDPATERIFGYLQVFSAIAVIFGGWRLPPRVAASISRARLGQQGVGDRGVLERCLHFVVI